MKRCVCSEIALGSITHCCSFKAKHTDSSIIGCTIPICGEHAFVPQLCKLLLKLQSSKRQRAPSTYVHSTPRAYRFWVIEILHHNRLDIASVFLKISDRISQASFSLACVPCMTQSGLTNLERLDDHGPIILGAETREINDLRDLLLRWRRPGGHFGDL